MKNNVLPAVLLMIIGIFVLSYFLPWWSPILWIIFITWIMKLKTLNGIFFGGLCFAIVWMTMARYLDVHSGNDIMDRTGELLGGVSSMIMLFITGTIAFITGALAGWLGSSFSKKHKSSLLIKEHE